VRHDDRRDYTKHMMLPPRDQIRPHANEISCELHDGTSRYQMMAGMFSLVCSIGLVCGETVPTCACRTRAT
jgi:hypothetical protein